MSLGVAIGGDAKKDEAQLQGVWKAAKDGKTGTMAFSGRNFTFTIEGDDKKEVFKGTFKLNAEAKPKEIDMMVTESPKEDFRNQTSLAIYELEGDTFKWCANAPGKKDRPPSFSEKFLLLEFKRDKK
jgi:uncharacterized protein (TIGR03067 family)